MKAALLCNGPSRKSYTPSEHYDFVMGCNVPWADVDATTMLDKDMIDYWAAHRDLITCPVYFSPHSWEVAKQIDDQFFQQWYADIIEWPDYWSSGHAAAAALITKGCTEIDVYGCDAYFDALADSSTDAYVVREKGPNWDLRARARLRGWKVRWDELAVQNPQVKIKFIR